jgi:hypothetical protein
MAAHTVQTHTRGQIGLAVVKHDTVVKHPADHAHHILGFKWRAQLRMRHGSTGAVPHFSVLQMHSRVRKQVMVSRMVVMHVRDDHVGHLRVRYAYHLETRIDGSNERAPALPGLLRVESCVDDDRVARAHYGPDKVIQGHGHVVRIPAKEVVGGSPFQVRVPDGEYFGVGAHWGRLPD